MSTPLADCLGRSETYKAFQSCYRTTTRQEDISPYDGCMANLAVACGDNGPDSTACTDTCDKDGNVVDGSSCRSDRSKKTTFSKRK